MNIDNESAPANTLNNGEITMHTTLVHKQIMHRDRARQVWCSRRTPKLKNEINVHYNCKCTQILNETWKVITDTIKYKNAHKCLFNLEGKYTSALYLCDWMIMELVTFTTKYVRIEVHKEKAKEGIYAHLYRRAGTCITVTPMHITILCTQVMTCNDLASSWRQCNYISE